MKKLAFVALLAASGAEAQRTQENTVREAQNGFGKSVGSETIGIYTGSDVRGFSAIDAGNNRIEGVYFDRAAQISTVIARGSTIRVGLSAFGYPLPAPTGILDTDLRRAGGEPVVSVQVTSGDYLGADLIVDAAIPVTDTFGINADFGLYDDEYVNGAGAWFVSYGGVARWRPVEGAELTGFFGRYDYGDEEQGPSVFTAGGVVPGRIKRRRFFGQEWADWAGHAQNYGGLAKLDRGGWEIAAGLFDSRFTRDEYHSAYYSGVDAAGIGRSFVIGGRDQRLSSTSGEGRVARVLAEGPRRHRVLAAIRGRRVEARYGGFAIADLGLARIGAETPYPRIDFATGPLTRDDVEQLSFAAGYEMNWQKVAELSLGLTRTRYRKSVAVPTEIADTDREDVWLWNAGLAVTPTDRLTLYGATTRGLEESGIAPSNATNRGRALPALRTKQWELGARYAFPGGIRLVSALFDIRKPYFEIDRGDGAFRELGQVIHRGVEASLSGQPVRGLSVVAGAVALRPRVTGQAVRDGRLGSRPIGRTGLLIDANIDYRWPADTALSIDAHATYEGRRVANALNTAHIPSRLILDIGARYRMRIRGTPVLIRPQIRNVADTFGWRVSGGGGYTLVPGRRITLSATIDL